MKKLICSLLLVSPYVYLISQKFEVQASTLTTVAGEPISIQYSFDGGNLPAAILPEVKNMLMVGNPMVGSNELNGHVSSQVVYQVVFTKPGTYIIPKTAVQSKAGKFESNTLKINVKKGNSRSIFPVGYEGREMVFLLKESKKEVFLGECVSIDLIIYAYTDNVVVEEVQLPKFNEGWVHEIKGPQDEKFREERFEGKRYFKSAYAKIWLVPFKTGTVLYGPGQVGVSTYIRLEVDNSQNDPFGFIQNEIQLPFRKKTNQASFTVRDLPVDKKPSSFINALGSFTTQVSLDKTQAKANESLKLKYVIKGTGNFPILEGPSLNLPDNFETFEPKVKDRYKIENEGISGEKEFEYYVIPRKEGEFWLGPFAFSYFDPETQKYVEVKSDSFLVTIQGMIADTTTGKQTVNNGVFTGEKVYKKTDPFFGNPFYYILLGLPFLAGLGMIIFRKKLFFTKKDDSEKKLKQAEDKVYKSLNEVSSLLQKGETAKSLGLLSDLYYQYICDKFKTTKNEVTRANLEKWLPDPALKTSATKIMDQLDQFRFAPAAQSDLNTLHGSIKSFVDELGKK